MNPVSAVKGLKNIGTKIFGFGTGMPKMGDIATGIGLPATYFGAGFLGESIAQPLIQSGQKMFTGAKEMRDMSLTQLNFELAARDQREKHEALQKDIARHAASLAATSPHLYNQILAGRILPQGAVVLGGTPRTDIMEQLAYGMATGQINEQPSPEADFFSTLGV